MKHQADPFRKGRACYLCQATLEYLIAVMACNPFLAALTSYMGMPDSMTGIVSSLPVIGYSFQFFSVLIHLKRAKPFVITLSIINQLLFTAAYLIPLLSLASPIKWALFTAIMILAYFFYNVAHPKKVHWYMSLVEESQRGRFTALKEMLFLSAGMICTYAMGYLIDAYKERGQMKTALILCIFLQIGLTLLHTLFMTASMERDDLHIPPRQPLIKNLKTLLQDPSVRKIIGVFTLLYLTSNSACSFYGTYQIKELGFNLQTASLLIILSSIARILVSPLWGRYADRHSFAKMCKLCFCLQALSFVAAMFSAPGKRSFLFFIYSILYWMAWGGINSSLVNLVYEQVSPTLYENALALTQAVSGVVGFLTTVLASPLVTHIQQAGNCFLGMQVYAQQVTSFLALCLNILLILFTHFSIKETKNHPTKGSEHYG